MTRNEISDLIKPLADSDQLFCDHFALGCHLLTLGHQRSGRRVCDFALKTAGIPEPRLSEIMAAVEDNAVEIGRAARPKEEIVSLLKCGSPGKA